MEQRLIFLYFSIKYKGNWDSIYSAIVNKEEPDEEVLKKYLKSLDCKFIALLDDEYPESLNHVAKPPFVLYYYGDISLLSDKYERISIVGSRDVSEYGEKVTTEFAKELSKEFVIVSGMARGVDGLAHWGAIISGGKSIAVLGSPINLCFPQSNKNLYHELKKNHLVISEFPPGREIKASNFPIRNRIIAGLSRCLLITEGKKKSGTSITAIQMLDMGGEICCVPARIGEDSLCNELISNGAWLVETVDDIYYAMGHEKKIPIF